MAEAKPVLMPKLGQTVEESTIVKWHKKEGDPVAKGDVLFEIETDKAVLEAESFYEGTLLKILVGEGVSVPVQSTVAFIGNEGDTIPEIKPPEKKPASHPEAGSPGPAPKKEKTSPPPASAAAAPTVRIETAVPGKKFVSPRARRLAREKVIRTDPIPGTGPNGRVTEKDVIAYLKEKKYDALRITKSAKKMAQNEGLDILCIESEDGKIREKDVRTAIREKPVRMSKMRQVIADRLTQSFRDIPHFFVTVSIDMTDLLAFRKELKERGEVYTITDFIMKAVVLSLKEFDAVNSMTPDGVHIKWNAKVHLGLAVSLDGGLVVPVVRHAEKLSMQQLHDTAQELIARARESKLTPDEMQGSTFTITNMGMFNVEQFSAIINPGEGAILAVSSAIPTPVVRDGEIVARTIMKVTLSADHRIIDGSTGAGFVNAIKEKLENVELWRNLI